MSTSARHACLCLLSVLAFGAVLVEGQTMQEVVRSAWYGHSFHVDTAGVMARSTIVLERPNLHPSEAMPLGNGQLGVALWSANGLTAQLNRADTLPHRLSPGQVIVPGLARLTHAKDYHGRLDLFRGEFMEEGGGMKAIAYVRPESDVLIIDITGAEPDHLQTADLMLWPPRLPIASAKKKSGVLAEEWADTSEPGASGQRFGSVSGISAEGRTVRVVVQDARTLRLSVMPRADGSFRLLIAASHWSTSQTPHAAVARALASRSPTIHREWWSRFWQRAGLIRVDSADGSGEYMENLRNIYLYAAASERGTDLPGSQAGVADLFSAVRDTHRWDPAAFWHLNLRMQVAANLGAGLPELNDAYFHLYRSNLANLQNWTREHMSGRPGICLPETMRFNGVGVEYEVTDRALPAIGLNCDAASKPFYNARTLSTGAEVSLWVWQQYLQTRDRHFLEENYPLLRESSRFLISYEQIGKDGLRHTFPSNAHETQWDVTDPVTDLAARRTLYTETIEAANLLGRDAGFVSQLHAALVLIPALPRTPQRSSGALLAASANATYNDVITESAEPSAPQHNVENIGLEPVWPYGLIGDDSVLTPLARRTFQFRPYPTNQDWSFDPIQAARLGLGTEVAATLVKLTKTYQAFANGFANWGGDSGEFYIEQTGVTATAMQEALVQNYDGVIRIAPALPPGWDFAGTVSVSGRTKIHVQTRSGVVQVCIMEAGTSEVLRVRNPWLGEPFDVVEDHTGDVILHSVIGPIVSLQAITGHRYILRRSQLTAEHIRFAPITGTPARGAKQLGPRHLGLAAASAR